MTMAQINPRDPQFLARWRKTVADADKRETRAKAMARGLGVTVADLVALVASLPTRNQLLASMASSGMYTLTADVGNPRHDKRVAYGEEALDMAPNGSIVVFRRFGDADDVDLNMAELMVYPIGRESCRLRMSGEFCYWVLLNLEPRPVTTLRDVLRVTGNTENHHLIDLLSALIDMGRIGLADVSDAARNVAALDADQALARDERHGWPRQKTDEGP